MTFVGTEVFLRDVLEEHFETLDFLWTQRRESARSSEVTHRELVDRDERIAAHSDGLVLAGPDGIEIIAPGLSSDEGSFSLAAGYVMLAARHPPAAITVVSAFQDAAGPAREGLRLALCYGPVEHTEPDLLAVIARGPSPAAAAAAAEALAFHGRFSDPQGKSLSFADDPDPGVRAAAWRITALLAAGGVARPPLLDRSADLQRAVTDPDGSVRAQALEAAAWSRQPWLLEHCRHLARATTPSPGSAEATELLAILGTPDDLELMRALVSDAGRGPARFELLASFGHPALFELLLAGFDPARPEEAAAAGLAFKRMTGIDAGSGQRVISKPSGAVPDDAFDEEFQDELELPDPDRARAALGRAGDKLQGRTRLARGFDVGPGASADVFAQLDLRSRHEAALRFAWSRKPSPTLVELEKFPQR